MRKVRFLQSVFLISKNNVYSLNDELDVDDKEAEELAEKGYVDILEEKPEVEKPVAKKPEAKKTPVKKTAPKKDGEE